MLKKWEREKERERERARESATESAMVRRGKIARHCVAEGRSAALQWSPKAFEIVVDDRKGKPQILIVEKKGGVSS